jgi:putative transposase
MRKPSPFRWFKTNRQIIRLPVMMYVWFLMSLRNVKKILQDRSAYI